MKIAESHCGQANHLLLCMPGRRTKIEFDEFDAYHRACFLNIIEQLCCNVTTIGMYNQIYVIVIQM